MCSFDEARELYNNGKYIEAFKAFNELDSSLDVNYYLGLCYFKGNGCKLNFNKAFEYFSNLAINKYEKSYYHLGYLYEFGLGVSRNFRQALLWYKHSAKLGNPDAMYRIGYIYRPMKVDKALKYLDEAISLDHIDSMLLKASIITDIDEQLKLYNRAALLGNKEALFRLSKYYIDNDIVHTELKNYLNESIKLGNIDAYPLYAKVLFEGKLLPLDYTLAIRFLESGSKIGSLECKRMLGDLYRDGQYVEKNLYKAILYYEDCAKNNDIESLYNLVNIYYHSSELTDHNAMALFYLLRIANLGDVNANRYCGILYEKGILTAIDLTKSYEYYSKAASLGDGYSKEALLKFKKCFNKIYLTKEKKC